MRKLLTYITMSVLLMLAGCSGCNKKTDWNISLKKEDKKPYGAYLCYQSLNKVFPQARIESLSKWFKYSSLEEKTAKNEQGSNAVIMLGLNLLLTEAEVTSLLDFAYDGNEVFISSAFFDPKLEKVLKIKLDGKANEETPAYAIKQDNERAVSLHSRPGETYGYKGRTIQNFFKVDSTYSEDYDEYFIEDLKADTLGMAGSSANFLRYKIGKGHITLHASPLVFSNYFLLQKNNYQYLNGIWQVLPNNIQHIYWSEFYKRTGEKNDMNVLWKYPATRWAIILAIITILMYVLFEGKRKQRIVPVIETPENNSVSFIETVGKLYHHKGDHDNLAMKMTQHFLEWVRMHHSINTNELNNSFIEKLSTKTGQSEQDTKHLVNMIHEVRLRSVVVDEAYLYELYNIIERFTNRHTHGKR